MKLKDNKDEERESGKEKGTEPLWTPSEGLLRNAGNERANVRENEGEESVDSFDQGKCQHRIAAVASTEDLRGENKGWFRSATVFHPFHPQREPHPKHLSQQERRLEIIWGRIVLGGQQRVEQGNETIEREGEGGCWQPKARGSDDETARSMTETGPLALDRSHFPSSDLWAGV